METQVDKLINSLFDTNKYSNTEDVSDPHANLKRYNLLLLANRVKMNISTGNIIEFGVFRGIHLTY
jgi:hypothetical protein